MKHRLAILLLALGLLGLARADEVEVIELKYRTAEQMIPTLSPLVEPGGGLSGRQNMLVIRSSRANIAQLKQVVATLDTMPAPDDLRAAGCGRQLCATRRRRLGYRGER